MGRTFSVMTYFTIANLGDAALTLPTGTLVAGGTVSTGGITFVNNGTSAPMTITLADDLVPFITIKDIAGNAGTYNITVTSAAGIDGGTTIVLNRAYQWVTLAWNGAKYGIIDQGLGTVNSNVGQFESITLDARGLATAGAALSGYGTTSSGVLTVNKVKGVTNASDAAAGDVGEFMSSQVLAASAVSVPNSTATNVTSLSLTAGDWDVAGNIEIEMNGGTLGAGLNAWISLTSATQPDASLRFQFNPGSAANSQPGIVASPIVPLRVNVNSTTSVYLSAIAIYSGGTGAAASGLLRARRMR
jgi:hypothetical protein